MKGTALRNVPLEKIVAENFMMLQPPENFVVKFCAATH